MNPIIIRYSEIALKGGNRPWFEKLLMKNIKNHLSLVTQIQVHKIHGRIFLETPNPSKDMIEILKCIPGIASFSQGAFASHDLNVIEQKALSMVQNHLKGSFNKSFRVRTRRAMKQFPLNSMELNIQIGGAIFNKFKGLRVDLENPEFVLGIEIWPNNKAVLFLDKIQGQGGLPIGSSHRVLSFLSGGIDSPVASWMMMKRGCNTVFLNFHSYPFIGEQSKQKVEDLVAYLSRFQPESTLLVAPFAAIQKAIREHCTEKFRTVLYRRMMLRIAEKLKDTYHIGAYVTGEAVGQVASQTIENIHAIGSISSIPIIRPLIGMEKVEIIERAKSMGTYPISIRPFSDCCTVFQPKSPATRAKIHYLEYEEKKFDFQELITEAVKNIEIIRIELKDTNQFVSFYS